MSCQYRENTNNYNKKWKPYRGLMVNKLIN